jgi:putative endonuclease
VRAKDGVGRYGEQVARDRLVADGYALIDTNWRGRAGELDAVAVAPDGTLVFVEVKTRSGLGFGLPAEAVTRRKAARLRALAGEWLAAHPDVWWPALRFDVIGVVRQRAGAAAVEHLQDVI